MTRPKKIVPKSRSPAQQAVLVEGKFKNSKKATCQVEFFKKSAAPEHTPN